MILRILLPSWQLLRFRFRFRRQRGLRAADQTGRLAAAHGGAAFRLVPGGGASFR